MAHLRRSYRTHLATIAVVGCALVLSACVTTVPKVDLDRYLGRWYQPEGYEQPFTAGLIGITADYARNSDGTVAVHNRGYRDSCAGAVSEIDGTATVVDTTTNAKLEVRFPSVPITTVIPGQYWIIGLDPDYRWAVVSDSLRASLFVLSRTPQLPADAVPSIDAILDAQGFDRSRIKQFPACP
jgi:apolipoprotein D and lipocalin family protein